jgi:hypothetical protein
MRAEAGIKRRTSLVMLMPMFIRIELETQGTMVYFEYVVEKIGKQRRREAEARLQDPGCELLRRKVIPRNYGIATTQGNI